MKVTELTHPEYAAFSSSRTSRTSETMSLTCLLVCQGGRDKTHFYVSPVSKSITEYIQLNQNVNLGYGNLRKWSKIVSTRENGTTGKNIYILGTKSLSLTSNFITGNMTSIKIHELV